jgi:hypothetical protein
MKLSGVLPAVEPEFLKESAEPPNRGMIDHKNGRLMAIPVAAKRMGTTFAIIPEMAPITQSWQLEWGKNAKIG